VPRADIYEMKLCSLTLDVAPRTGKIIKNGLVFLKEEKNMYFIIFVFWISQLLEIELYS